MLKVGHACCATLGAICVLMGAVAGCDARSAEEATSQAAQRVTEVGKGALTGLGEGINSGRQTTTGPDGAVVVVDRAGMEKFIELSVLGAKDAEGGRGVVELAVQNRASHPVRLSGWTRSGAVIAIDGEGFSTELKELGKDDFEITVPPEAKVRCTLAFGVKASSIAKVRIWGQEYPVPGKQ